MHDQAEAVETNGNPDAPAHGTDRRNLTGDAIYNSLYDSIVSHLVPPGTKLTEEVLAEVFDVSRTVIRSVLQMLASDGVVTITPRRGAHVTRPQVSEARDVFSARRVIEIGILSQWNGVADPELIAILDQHMDAERKARSTGDQKTLLRLSGDFHLKVAALSGNAILQAMLRDLLSRSVLATAVYQRSGGAGCYTDHHQTLVDLIRKGEKGKAIRKMIRHIEEIEAGLDFGSDEKKPIDLRSVLVASRSGEEASNRQGVLSRRDAP
jgi:DNA-binding GntR family transcriptional regulator